MRIKVDDTTLKEYIALPKSQRERFGFYISPLALPWGDWGKWEAYIKEEYPIQWFFRVWCTSFDNPLYYAYWSVRDWCRDTKWAISNFIKPGIPRARKSIPRHKWNDITSTVVEFNFALILDFWYEEACPEVTHVDWTASGEMHSTFIKWVEESVEWIEQGRVGLNKELDLAYSNISKDPKISFTERYAEVHRIEKELRDKETEILTEFVKRREYFWT